MTAEKLLEVFEAYYGEKYGGIFKKLVLEYLAGMSPDFYRTCAGVVIRRFPRSFGKAPGIAEIEAHMGEILDTMPRRYGYELPDVSPENRLEKSLVDMFRMIVKQQGAERDDGNREGTEGGA